MVSDRVANQMTFLHFEPYVRPAGVPYNVYRSLAGHKVTLFLSSPLLSHLCDFESE
jgi:hypothetical protein